LAASALTTATAHKHTQLILTLFHQVIDVGNLGAIALRGTSTATVFIVAIATTLVASALVVAAPSPGAAAVSCHSGYSLPVSCLAFP
jgi:hypothetical protein